MYVSVTFFEDPSINDKLRILKTLSQGKFKVYKAYSEFDKQAYALKLFPNDASGKSQYKKESIISDLSHPNIIKYVPASIGFENDSDFHCILTEYAKYGELFELVKNGMFTSEIIVRTYFHQLIAGIGYMHSQGVAHLDLKLENVMLGSGFELKVIDFDLAQQIEDDKITSAGTPGYRAPEVIDGTCNNFRAADIYSMGVILYAMKAQSAPFAEVSTQGANDETNTSLKHYSTFIKNNEAFWKMKSGHFKDPAFFSKDFKDLMNGMLQFDISKRFTLNDVKNSKWFKGPILSKEELRAEMRARWQLLKRK